MFYSEGVSWLNYASIINAVVRAGLGYEYEPGFECPLWFTVKEDVGRNFRTLVQHAISAEIQGTRHQACRITGITRNCMTLW